MPKNNFSATEAEAFNLAVDLAHVDFSAPANTDIRGLEGDLRDKINHELDGGLTLKQAWRRNQTAIFEIMEQVVTTSIGENILTSPFIDNFVEVRNVALGDSEEFYSEGGLLTVAKFAGNHWDTNRQMLDLGESFTLPSEWLYIHVYEDFERFLLGIIPFEKMTEKVYKSFNKYIQDRIYAQFQSVSNSVPSQFTATGNNEEALGKLCDLVQAAGGYGSLTIAGTKAALRKLANIVPDKMFASSQKEAKAMSGSIGEWEGNKLMVIPQTLKSGTFEFALSDKDVFILGGDVKPIKLALIGDTYTDEDKTGMKNDRSIDLQVQTKIGLGMMLPEAFGKFTFQ